MKVDQGVLFYDILSPAVANKSATMIVYDIFKFFFFKTVSVICKTVSDFCFFFYCSILFKLSQEVDHFYGG